MQRPLSLRKKTKLGWPQPFIFSPPQAIFLCKMFERSLPVVNPGAVEGLSQGVIFEVGKVGKKEGTSTRRSDTNSGISFTADIHLQKFGESPRLLKARRSQFIFRTFRTLL